MKDVVFSTATALAGAIRDRRISAMAVLEAHLAQIAKHNAALNAVVTLDADGARQRAQAADAALARGESWGSLHGVPLTLKDTHAVAGMRTTAGWPPLAGYLPPRDGTIAARLRAAGAIVVGRTNVAMLLGDWQSQNPIFGRTNNPWNVDRTSGGSSGGACAAVAAGLTPLEFGTDLSGSIRIPAHYCGVYGLKPTEHRVSLDGIVAGPPDSPRPVRIMSAIGPIARDVDDLRLAFGIIAGADGRDTDVPPLPIAPYSAVALRGLRLAWTPTFPGALVADDIRHAIEALAKELGRAGCRVEQRLPDVDFAKQIALFAELVTDVVTVLQPQTSGAAPLLLADYIKALDRRDAYIIAWEHFFGDWDALLCPVAMTTAIAHCAPGTPLEVDGSQVPYMQTPIYCAPFNLTGHPAVVVPIGLGRDGLPIGLQVVGPRWGDERLLAIAKALSDFTTGYRRPPGY